MRVGARLALSVERRRSILAGICAASAALACCAPQEDPAATRAQVFQEMVNVSGLIVTKLDGSAKGGGVVALADQFKLPIHAVGVGEGVDDLQSFDAESFARSLLGL